MRIVTLGWISLMSLVYQLGYQCYAQKMTSGRLDLSLGRILTNNSDYSLIGVPEVLCTSEPDNQKGIKACGNSAYRG